MRKPETAVCRTACTVVWEVAQGTNPCAPTRLSPLHCVNYTQIKKVISMILHDTIRLRVERCLRSHSDENDAIHLLPLVAPRLASGEPGWPGNHAATPPPACRDGSLPRPHPHDRARWAVPRRHLQIPECLPSDEYFVTILGRGGCE